MRFILDRTAFFHLKTMKFRSRSNAPPKLQRTRRTISHRISRWQWHITRINHNRKSSYRSEIGRISSPPDNPRKYFGIWLFNSYSAHEKSIFVSLLWSQIRPHIFDGFSYKPKVHSDVSTDDLFKALSLLLLSVPWLRGDPMLISLFWEYSMKPCFLVYHIKENIVPSNRCRNPCNLCDASIHKI